MPASRSRAARLEAVDARQHDVEDDRVVLRRLGHPERVLALDRDVGGEPLVAQPAADQARHLDLVLDDQHPHGRESLRAQMRTEMNFSWHALRPRGGSVVVVAVVLASSSRRRRRPPRRCRASSRSAATCLQGRVEIDLEARPVGPADLDLPDAVALGVALDGARPCHRPRSSQRPRRRRPPQGRSCVASSPLPASRHGAAGSGGHEHGAGDQDASSSRCAHPLATASRRSMKCRDA